MELSVLIEAFSNCRETKLSKRYISPDYIQEYLENLPNIFEVKCAGKSVQERSIFSVKVGTGKTKILMWSQMHGNESTTTKSLLDFFNFLQSKNYQETIVKLLNNCTFLIFPMLNPDGSFLWTRNNANDLDLNRDAQLLSQPESKILRSAFQEFSPDYCFNLHGQRTIYGFEDTGKPSILSFLSPSANENRDFPLSRKRAANIISHIYTSLQEELSGHIGLYDDGFNRNCVGDTFQEAGVPTILFEAGHSPNDYSREDTRKYVFISLLKAIEAAMDNLEYPLEVYQSIPKHSKCYCDVHMIAGKDKINKYYKETKEGSHIRFDPIDLPQDYGKGTFSYKKVEVMESFKV